MAEDDGSGDAGRGPTVGERLWTSFGDLPTAASALIVLAVAAATVLAGRYLYRTYTYVQHDNEFCLSCHLMEEPYERFARSAHRGLSCKACHRPTLLERGRMGLAQILEQPEEIRAHAEVPNETCAECHIEGDPEQWRLIRNTAGHRVHLESDDPALQGLQCVECHSTSLHEFAPTTRTCGQAGCHEDVEVRLGGMGQLTIHCQACHSYLAPAATGDTARAMVPRQAECLSCHTMRVMLADFPQDGPHEADCGACHNPHEQETPRAAVASCVTSGCHARLDTARNFHHRLESRIVEDCVRCHTAHDFSVQESDCRSCHQEIFRSRRSAAGSRFGNEGPGPAAPDEEPPARGGTRENS